MASYSYQSEMFGYTKQSVIEISPSHRLVRLAEILDWAKLIGLVQGIRQKKLKSPAGRKPHLRALIGAVIFMALRNITYRQAEDYIQHYGPARYLCGLTETKLDTGPHHDTRLYSICGRGRNQANQ